MILWHVFKGSGVLKVSHYELGSDFITMPRQSTNSLKRPACMDSGSKGRVDCHLNLHLSRLTSWRSRASILTFGSKHCWHS